MSEYIVQSSSLTAVANKIREKTGESAPLEFPDDYIAAINNMMAIPTTPQNSILFYSRHEFSISIDNRTKNWDGNLFYSTDNENWSTWSGVVDISAALNKGCYRLYLRGSGNTRISNGYQQNRFKISGAGITCTGNFQNLLDYENKPFTAGYACFAYMFHNVSNTSFDIELPFTTLDVQCYQNMFYGCNSLVKAPELPAQTLTTSCYSAMFQNCTALTEPPALKATSLASRCYQNMFYGCNHLTKLPELSATALSDYCYANMFQSCSAIKLSLTQSEEYPNEYRIPSTGTGTDATNALQNMFQSTGGTFTGTPTINTTYYTSNTVVPST